MSQDQVTETNLDASPLFPRWELPGYARAQLAATVPQVHELHRVNLARFLEEQDGKFVGIDFIKKDNEPRTLNGRLGITTHRKGGDNTTEADFRPYLTVYDVESAGYRNVNLATVSRVRALGAIYDVID